jgi:hypothetical protein
MYVDIINKIGIRRGLIQMSMNAISFPFVADVGSRLNIFDFSLAIREEKRIGAFQRDYISSNIGNIIISPAGNIIISEQYF